MKKRLILSLAILIMAVMGAVSASAQGPEPGDQPSYEQPPDGQQPLEQPPYQQQPNEQPPSGQAGVDISPGVARISLVQGDVSTQRGDSGEWAAAVVNAPIVTGDKVSTGDNARAEVQLDFANILRLGDRAQATIANMTRNQIQVQVGQGIANYDVFKGSDSDAEIDTPNLAIHPNREGSSFRVIINSNDETEVIVRRGDVQISTPQGSTRVDQGKIITVHGTGDDTAYKVADAPQSDDWDSWINDRNNRIENAKSWNHTDRYYTGSEDLDAYGQWKQVPDYGSVWVPAQGPGWAPYRDGRWTWEPYYGWTWVPYEPWGWAPYHYGRWLYQDSAWAWWPGPVVGAPYYRPVWAPAYVSFYGFGGGVGVSVGFGFGSFGWLPLGPGDYCHPWWGGYRGRYNVVNINHVTNVYNNRRGEWGGLAPLRSNGFSNVRLAATNEHIRAGISAVPAGGFGTGRISARGVDSGVFRDGHMMTGNLPVVPSRESLSASNRPASMSTIRGGQQHFFGTSRPGNVQSFDRQAAQVQQSIQHDGRFTAVRSGESLSARNGTTGSMRPTERDITTPSASNSGNKPSPEIRPQANENGRGAGTSNGGFTRFGSPQTQNRGDQNGAQDNRPQGANQSGNQGSAAPRTNVPRPPQGAQNGQSEGSRTNTSDQSGWHRFSDSGSQRGSGTFNNSNNNSNSGSRNVPRPPSSSNSSGSFGNRSSAPGPQPRGNTSGDYRSFGSSGASRNSVPQPSNRGSFGGGSEASRFPSSRSAAPSYGGNQPSRYPSSGAGAPSYGGNAPSRFPSSRSASPSYGGNRGYSSPSYPESARGSSSRPPLDMRQPIVGGHSAGRYAPPSSGYRGGGGSSSHGSSGSSHGGGSPHSGGRGR